MAKYDRRILVPYLQDVCCVEMLCRKLEQDVRHAKSEADKYAGWANRDYRDPVKPTKKDCKATEHPDASDAGCLGRVGIIAGILLMIPNFVLGTLILAFGLFQLWIWRNYVDEANEETERNYLKAINEYDKQCKQNKKWRDSVPSWSASAQRWRQKENAARSCLQKAQKLRNDLYGVNIIPSRYRTIHAAYYLYDFFNSGRETDLERTIQTMLLDEIVQRMDKIIAQNQEIIINQRMQIAQQAQQNRAIAEGQREQMRQIACMEQNQQRQIDYQNMIARNQQVTNFFLAADYLRKK